ncbi:MAG TPA: hypothetical protein VK845_02780, partial [Gemmatimonadales bacterium]|nr:hypothetical protein [Gemmatimonadales bacterium]
MSRPAEQLEITDTVGAPTPVILDRKEPSGVAIVGHPNSPMVAWFLDGVAAHLEARGHPVHRPRG